MVDKTYELADIPAGPNGKYWKETKKKDVWGGIEIDSKNSEVHEMQH